MSVQTSPAHRPLPVPAAPGPLELAEALEQSSPRGENKSDGAGAAPAPAENIYTPTTKCYRNQDYLNSRAARSIRIMCEYQQPAEQLRSQQVKNTILLFGSARGKDRPTWDAILADLTKQVELSRQAGDEGRAADLEARLSRHRRTEWMCEYFQIVTDLAQKLAQWSVERGAQGQEEYSICTGGGPGLMEAANKGAAMVPGAKSIGMGISLPFEAGLNKYVDPELAFEFHYFFTRKLWMSMPAKALIVAPGGFGTCDELFEFMTLQQTGKRRDTPIVLLGSDYWKRIVNWQALADFGTVSDRDVTRIKFADTAAEAFEILKAAIIEMESSADSAEIFSYDW